MPVLNILWADTDQMALPSGAPLSAYRENKLASIKHKQTRRCSLCAELLLIEAVRREAPDFPLPLVIEADSYGKPRFADREFEFSLSHSTHFAACALSDSPIGLDIQSLAKCDERLVRRFFTQREQDVILSSKNRDAAFTRLWCRKESFLKAIGLGLRLPLDSFDLSDEDPTVSFREKAYGFREYRAEDLFFCICMPFDALPENMDPQKVELPF